MGGNPTHWSPLGIGLAGPRQCGVPQWGSSLRAFASSLLLDGDASRLSGRGVGQPHDLARAGQVQAPAVALPHRERSGPVQVLRVRLLRLTVPSGP